MTERASVSRQLAIEGSERAPIVPEVRFLEAAARAAERVMHPHSEATQRAYRVAWNAWGEHCARHRMQPLPIEPERLVGYLELLSVTHAPNTVRLHLSALAVLDQAARITPVDKSPQSLRSSAIVHRWLRSWGREHPRAPRKQAPSITPAELEHLLSLAQEPGFRHARSAHAARYARDRAMILVGICAGLRVSELAELELGRVVVGERGLTVHVARSKADQQGKGRIAGLLPQGALLRCPVDAWAQWVSLRGTWSGPAFVEVDRQGALGNTHLNERSCARAIQARARRAGLVLVSSHSLRATLATLATERGKTMSSVADQGGWASLDVLRGYVRQGELFNASNPTAGLLDD